MTAHTKTVDVGEMVWLRISMYPLNLFFVQISTSNTLMESKKIKIKRFAQLVGSRWGPFGGVKRSLRSSKAGLRIRVFIISISGSEYSIPKKSWIRIGILSFRILLERKKLCILF
jgi:hypothetical protein